MSSNSRNCNDVGTYIFSDALLTKKCLFSLRGVLIFLSRSTVDLPVDKIYILLVYSRCMFLVKVGKMSVTQVRRPIPLWKYDVRNLCHEKGYSGGLIRPTEGCNL